MTTEQAVQTMSDVLRRKHFALSTERSYIAWLRRYCDFIKTLPSHLGSEQKLERFLTALAKKDVAASTQNQAFNAMVFFYQEVLRLELKDVRALRARRPARVRSAPSRVETLQLINAVEAEGRLAVSLVVRLLYGCGLRVTEPLHLRIKDVNVDSTQLIIRGGKGAKDRVVAIPCSALEAVREQMESARVIWKRDQINRVPVALPFQLAAKYPQAGFDWNWAWLFPGQPDTRTSSGAGVLACGKSRRASRP